jgi:Icc protein
MVSAGTIHVLQITDLHLLPVADARLLGVDTARSLDAVLRSALSQCLPDALLVTGDIAHTPADATYARVREFIAARFRGPALWLAGNHDLTAPLSAARPAADEFEMASWSVIAIDTHVDGREGGWIADAELDRLRERLERSRARFVVVTGHHPPLPLGTPWLDSGCIANGPELLDVLAGDARVKAYVCGHVHQETATAHRGLQLLTTPSTCFQFVGGTRSFSVDATPPGWRWLDLAADGTLTSRVGRATDFAVTLDLSTFKKH